MNSSHVEMEERPVNLGSLYPQCCFRRKEDVAGLDFAAVLFRNHVASKFFVEGIHSALESLSGRALSMGFTCLFDQTVPNNLFL